MITLEPAFPLMNTPDPSLPASPAAPLAVPLLVAVTLFKVTMLALLIVIPSPSLPVAVTLFRVTVGALNVAPSYVFPVPFLMDSEKVVSLIVMDPVPVVAENP